MSQVSFVSQDTLPRLSLLTLSIAAANAAPITPPERSSHVGSNITNKHRRLSSAGRSRRRLSDARDAATRPFPTSLQTASASLAALSLSSPTVSHRQPIQPSTSELEPSSVEDTTLSISPPPSVGPKSGRKRGTIFTCESCSKVYRHPSCLIKHRWEHTPQWQEASKYVLSKHQQVQLLEAAAILSHLSPFSASLPEDRSLWPSFLSGGLIPPPTAVLNNDVKTATAFPSNTSHAISTSVPASTPKKGVPMPVPRAPAQTTADDALNLLALRSGNSTGSWGEPTSVPPSHSRAHSHSHINPPSSSSRERERRRSNAYEYSLPRYDYASNFQHHLDEGWSLPRSSVRSKSGSSRSRSQSASESRSDDELEDEGDGVDVRVGSEDETEGRGNVYGSRVREEDIGVRKVEQTWDGMEMEMEMD